MARTVFTSAVDSRAAAIRAAAPTVGGRCGFDLHKSAFAKMLAEDELCAQVCERAGVDVALLHTLCGVSLHAGIATEAAEALYRAALALAPLVIASMNAERLLRVAIISAQERLLGRAAGSDEKDNFRTRAATRLLTTAVRFAAANPRLLDDADTLRSALTTHVAAALDDPHDADWGTSWVSQKRRENGAGRVVTPMDEEQAERWTQSFAEVRPRVLGSARRLAGSASSGDDLLQEASLRVFASGACDGDEELERRLRYTIRQVNYERRASEHHAGSLELPLQDDTRGIEIHLSDVPSLTAWREGQSDIQAAENRMDARRALTEVLKVQSELAFDPSRARVASALAKLATEVVAGRAIAPNSPDELTGMLLSATHEGDPARARSIVVSALTAIRRATDGRATNES